MKYDTLEAQMDEENDEHPCLFNHHHQLYL